MIEIIDWINVILPANNRDLVFYPNRRLSTQSITCWNVDLVYVVVDTPNTFL